MSKAARIIFGLIIALMIITASNAFSADKKADAKETYIIGVAAPLTGGLASLGEGIQNALKMAQEDLGDTHYDYKVITEDNQHDPKMSVTLAKKFISVNKADAIISIGDESGPVVRPIALENNVLHFAIAVQRSIAKGHDVNFMHWTPALDQTALLISEMKKRGVKTVAVFRSRYVGFVEIYNAFEKNLKGSGIKIVTEQIHDAGATDFHSQIAMAKKENPDIYVILTLPPSLEILAKQLKESGVTTPLTACEAFDITPEPALFEGNYYVAPAQSIGGFRKAYVEKYGIEPPMMAGNAYDIFNLIVRAAESAARTGKHSSKPGAKQVAEELHNIKYHLGALGSMYIDEDGVVVTKPQVKIIKDGKPTAFYK